jgi:hypothetical protein
MADVDLTQRDTGAAHDPRHAFLFDVKLFVLVNVHAPDEATAREMLAKALDGSKLDGGAWPNGEPLLMEASVDGEADLMELDGEAV